MRRIGNHEASIQLQILVKDENVGLVTIAFLALSFVISKDLDIKLVSLTKIRGFQVSFKKRDKKRGQIYFT